MIVFLAVIGLTACEKEKLVGVSELPNDAQQYIETHFGGIEVSQVVKDIDGLRHSYDVYLANGVELEFNKSGEVRSVENKRNDRLPNSVVPTKILSYVEENFPDQYIVSWDIDDRDQEVELSNGMDLKFSKSGDFIRID